MSDFTITERKESFTLDEVFDFIDDTNISKMDAHELKCRIADVVQEVRNQSEEELKFLKQWKEDVMEGFCKYDASSVEEIAVHARNKAIDDFTAKLIKHISNVPGYRIGGGNVFVIADEMKGGA